MYFLRAEPKQALEEKLGLRRAPDSDYLRAGVQPPTLYQMHMAARIKLTADRKSKRSTPQWIRDWAEHPYFTDPNFSSRSSV